MSYGPLLASDAFPFDAVDVALQFAMPCADGTGQLPPAQAAKAMVRRAFVLGSVCKRWHRVVCESEVVWRLLARATFLPPVVAPERVPWSLPRYRKRMKAQDAMRPLAAEQLTPIEDCELAYECPMLLEALTATGEVTGTGLEVLHCHVCRKNVYPCQDQAELDANTAAGRCVMFRARERVTSASRPVARVVVVDEAPDAANARMVMQALAALQTGSRTTGIFPTLTLGDAKRFHSDLGPTRYDYVPLASEAAAGAGPVVPTETYQYAVVLGSDEFRDAVCAAQPGLRALQQADAETWVPSLASVSDAQKIAVDVIEELHDRFGRSQRMMRGSRVAPSTFAPKLHPRTT